MQDEVNSKVVALSVRVADKGMHMSKAVLQAAMRKWLRSREQSRTEKRLQKSREPTHGKQTVAELMKQNQGLSKIEVTDQNIKSFEKVANKYNIDFSLMKEKGTDPLKYMIFFKARDVDIMTQAFKEYSTKELSKSNKPSIRKLLEKYVAKIKEQSKDLGRNKQRERHRDRGQEL